MKLWLLLMTSLMTSCYITAAPPPQPGQAPFHIPPGQAKKVAEEVKEEAEEALQLKLEYIVKKAELELQELELKAEVFQAIQEHFSDVQLSPEQLLLLRHPDDTSSDEDEMSPEQKLLEARLLQGLAMDHEQLLRLAELRALKSGMSTIQELFLLHHANIDLTPQQIAILKAFSPSQLLKYYIFKNSGSDLLASLADKLSELARGKILLENNEALLYSLLKNHQPHQRRMSLTDLALIQNYQEAMSQSMRRSRFLLMMHMMGMSLDVEDMTPEEKTILASMIHRAEQQMNEKWMKEEALLLRRYRQGEATLAGTMLAYRRLEATMNSGLGDHLRTLVTNEIRMKLVSGSGIGMNPDGTWMNGWMNGEQWMNASDSERLSELWELYKLRYVRNYNDRGEERMRRRNFESKVSEMIMHNMEAKLKQQFYTMALNNLTDWAQEELDKLRGYTSISSTEVDDDLEAQEKDVEEGEKARVALPVMPTYTNTVPTSQLPASVNWSSTNWVGPVQNQYQCGSCWSFSAAGALEAQYYNKTQTFVAMSEQNLVDCTYYLGNLGCSGGNVELAFDYVMTVGIDTFASYPYTGRDNNGTCLYNAANSVTQATSWRLIPSGNELALQQAVALAGPVSVAIDASLSSFDSYSGGVYAPTNCSTTALDHAVLVVGYGTTSDGQDYWLIKNSWGVDWGINGYMMMERGVNMCGIATEALFPVID